MPDAWLIVANPAEVMTYCGECGEPFRKGDKTKRIEGGYGWRCERHSAMTCPECGCNPNDAWGCDCSNPDCPCSEEEE